MTRSTQPQNRISVIFDCLSRARRRYCLHRLHNAETPIALADLAEDVANWESDRPKAEIADETIQEVALSLYHQHIPKLAEAGLVQYDQERTVVELLEYPEELDRHDQLLTVKEPIHERQ